MTTEKQQFQRAYDIVSAVAAGNADSGQRAIAAALLVLAWSAPSAEKGGQP